MHSNILNQIFLLQTIDGGKSLHFWFKIIPSIVNRLGVSINQNNGKLFYPSGMVLETVGFEQLKLS